MCISKTYFFVLLVCVQTAFGQTVQQTGWLASFNTIKFNKNWSLHAEWQLRSTDDLKQVQTILKRLGINYHIRPNQVLTAGYAYIPNRVTAFGKSAMLGENRIWQQFVVTQPLVGFVLAHRFRLEERFVPRAAVAGEVLQVRGHLYSTRLRYFTRAVIPFKKQRPFIRGVFCVLQEEVFANISHQDNANGKLFDQNRLYGAVGYRFSESFDVEAGYLNQFVARRAMQQNLVNHVVQLAFYTRL